MTYYAPAGTPVLLRDILHGLVMAPAPAVAAATSSLQAVSGLPHAWLISSGRAAMTIILQAMRNACKDAHRDEVIIPAYTCYSVPAAIERAGLKPRLCDIDPETLGMAPDALERCDFSRTLAVITANLYGLPNDLPEIEAVCRRRGVFLLDDAAQALGATLNGRPAGSFGDAGLYSFDKGKVISTIQGGAIVCAESVLAARLADSMAVLPPAAFAESTGNLAKLAIYSIFLRPVLYGMIRRMPLTGLGHTRYEVRYPITRLSPWQIGVAAGLLSRLATFRGGRRERAHDYRRELDGVPGVSLIRELPGAESAFVRYPFRLSEPECRDRVVNALDLAGFGATISYPLALADVPEVIKRIPASDRDCPGARIVAQTLVTLPTHAYCSPQIAARVRQVILECLT